MKIARIEISQHQLPLDPPFLPSWSSKPRVKFDATIVRVFDEEGRMGVGSGDYMMGFAGHEPLFIGEDVLRLERHNRVIDHISFHYGRAWPLDLALWDLAGRVVGQPCWKMLGGLADRVPAYASSGVLRDAGAMADYAERVLERGFKALKIRFRRGDIRADLAALEAVRKKIGDRLELMVDCNQGWRFPWDTMAPWTLKQALDVARELERFGVFWMEEPLHRADREGMRRLRDRVDLRIAGGELDREMHEFRDLLAEGCLDVLQPDVIAVGGITGLKRVAAMASAANVMMTPHTWGNGIGLLGNLHLTAGACDAAFIEFPWDPPDWTIERRDFMLTHPIDIDAKGDLVLSDAPGFGCTLDEERLAATRVDGGTIRSNN
jgi:L-alanine-DL-glutamate epimerase-like enolase superfamily enzyme